MVYKIGELAKEVGVSKRTIDYYTNLGLLEPERSESGHRFYNEASLETLKFIEQCKSMHLPLQEIKEILDKKKTIFESQSIAPLTEEVTVHMNQLQSELSQLKFLLENLSEDQKLNILRQLTSQTSELIQTLLSFIL
ncbi:MULTISPECIES: MerR family transcriptional regulator [unclassified Bacillus (in: firmicutes)]|uniref:MerR family transcriptional regulator n=1 Tax=unclassified Bacillus (in: firmicutes) TaxID=185979 RepID=UPI000BF1630B|nr:MULTISPECIES: MerR family transcriptional regulator [unclassified Bacillus (in: firmicutes)]PEJ49342.1 MerR family transcriptional regulator [Bacillus sp. AFS002410]PEL13419.1 MerR family transcriptional regulator [Bacillus sp. AFS017336]